MSETQILVLNSHQEGDDPSGMSQVTGDGGGVEISEMLQKAVLRMTGKFLKEATGTVDYQALRNSKEFRDYCAITASLKKVKNLSALSPTQYLGFFINIYNALTVHSICEIQKTTDIGTTLDVPNFWGTHAYNIGGFIFTLDDIEHGILRGNRAHPSTGKQVIGADDPRVKFAVNHVEPRIHFALNCGAKSCPMVRVYNSNNLEDALEAATRSYLSQEVYLEEDGTLKIPQILEWYLRDFADNQNGMLRWIEPYVGPTVQQKIRELLAASNDDESCIQYFYDWSLNKA